MNAPPAGSADTPSSLWRIPAMLLLVGYAVAGFTGFYITSSALPAWLSRNGTPDSTAGLVTTVLLVSTVCTQLLVPSLVKKFGNGPVLLVGAIALGGPTPLLLLSNELWWVLGISAVRGAGFAALTVLGSTLVAKIVPGHRRGEAIGIYGLAAALPGLAAVPGGVAFVSADLFGWVAVIGAAPVLGAVLAVALARAANQAEAALPTAPREPTKGTQPHPSARRLAIRMAALPALVLMLVTLAGGAFSTYVPIERSTGTLATIALLLYGLTGAVGRWQVGALADRRGLRWLLPLAVITAAVGVSSTAVGLWGANTVGDVVVLVGAALLGLGYGATQNLTLVAAFNRAKHRETATVSAVWNSGFDAGTAIGAALVGALIPWWGIPGGLIVTAVLVVLMLPGAVISGRGAPSRSSADQPGQ